MVEAEWQQRLTELLAKRAQRRDAIKALRAQLAAARAAGKAASHNNRLSRVTSKEDRT